MSCHRDPKRWRKDGKYAYLSTVPIGQEFVLDCEQRPASAEWLAELFDL